VIGAQRWRERRTVFRKPDQLLRPREYEVAVLPDDRLAKPFVWRHHYLRTYPAARFRFGLFWHDWQVGVAVFSHPTNDKVLTNVFGGTARESVELGRFVLLDAVPYNGESWFFAQCLRVLRKTGLRGVVSFSDPVPRRTVDGCVVCPGHVGTIYQAGNAAYLGRGSPTPLFLLPDGTTFSKRAISKVRNDEQGRDYACRHLMEFGADDPRKTVGWVYESYAEWLGHWLPLLTRRVRHPGNHRYAWTLDGPRVESTAPPPKQLDCRLSLSW
jgi:hypothetical protein